jgi:cell division transport system permease protein
MAASPYRSRSSALRAALALTLGRPVAFALVTLATGLVFATLAIVALAAWRAAPLEAPAWLQAEALVLAAGAEGETDLAALRAALRAAVQPPALLATVDFVGRDAALRELAQRKSLSGIGLAELRPNPLPDAFHVRFAAGSTPDSVEAAVGALRRVKGVDSVEYQPELLRRAAILAQFVEHAGALAAAFVAAAVVLAVVLAATFWSRADPQEARVLYLLGAEPAAWIRPGAYAAGLGVLCAALLAWWIVAVAAVAFEPSVAALAQKYGLHWSPDPVPPWGAPVACLLAACAAAGLGAGVLRLGAYQRAVGSA